MLGPVRMLENPKHYDSGFNYGAEFRQEHLNQAIANAPKIGVPAQEIEKQSQMNEESHGTHVASIAAGNRGICHNAQIAAVLISLTADDEKRRSSFYDSTRIAHAVDYLFAVAKELSEKEKRTIPVQSISVWAQTDTRTMPAAPSVVGSRRLFPFPVVACLWQSETRVRRKPLLRGM